MAHTKQSKGRVFEKLLGGLILRDGYKENYRGEKWVDVSGTLVDDFNLGEMPTEVHGRKHSRFIGKAFQQLSASSPKGALPLRIVAHKAVGARRENIVLFIPRKDYYHIRSGVEIAIECKTTSVPKDSALRIKNPTLWTLDVSPATSKGQLHYPQWLDFVAVPLSHTGVNLKQMSKSDRELKREE